MSDVSLLLHNMQNLTLRKTYLIFVSQFKLQSACTPNTAVVHTSSFTSSPFPLFRLTHVVNAEFRNICFVRL